MLLPEEFSVGSIDDATGDLTLLLSRGEWEYPMLITKASGSLYAIFLAGPHRFTGFESAGNDNWKGVIVPNVKVEVDAESVFNADSGYPPLGALVRKSAQLDIISRMDRGFRDQRRTPLLVNLPAGRQDMAAAFTKWRIFIGDGITKRELMRIDTANGNDRS